MDQRTPYELIIAEKLQNIPIPDMADQIWSRVKFQLDIDMPTDDDSDPPGGGQTPPDTGFYLGGVGLLVLAAILAVFHARSLSGNQEPAPAAIVPASNPQPEIKSGVTEKSGAIKTPSAPASVARYREYIPATPLTGDSVFVAGEEPRVTLLPDSFATETSPDLKNDLPPGAALTDSVPVIPGKKRGVSGITENDYRIVPKKKDQQPY